MKRLTGYLSIPIGLILTSFFSAQPVQSISVEVGNNFTPESLSGKTGGAIETKDCGFIANAPNHIINVRERINYMKIGVKADGGQPTLLIYGPGNNDRFCVLGNNIAGFKLEMSGVWEPGPYRIYIGDRTGNNYPFILNISPKNN